jgi:hypothetical protein
VLCATTVIEVGVDVPNASVMVIENAERFGLAQLHQLRGVGRGRRRSSACSLRERLLTDARRRLDFLVATGDGFRIAEEDFRLRGQASSPAFASGRPEFGRQPGNTAGSRRPRALAAATAQRGDLEAVAAAVHCPGELGPAVPAG